MELLLLLLAGGLFGMFDNDTSDNSNNTGDTITGTDGDDDMKLGRFDDRAEGLGGADTIRGDTGFDDIYGGEGADILYGGDGMDMLSGDVGSDQLYGGAWDDGMFGGNGSDLLEGGGGNDLLVGGNGSDTLTGGNGADSLFGGAGQDNLDGGGGNDVLVGSNIFNRDTHIDDYRPQPLPDGVDPASGEAIGFTGFGDFATDTLSGGNGDDTLILADNDVANGGGGQDVFVIGDWIDAARPAEIQDFNVNHDQIRVVTDNNLPAPDVEVRFVDADNAEVVIGGQIVANVQGSGPDFTAEALQSRLSVQPYISHATI